MTYYQMNCGKKQNRSFIITLMENWRILSSDDSENGTFSWVEGRSVKENLLAADKQFLPK